MLLRAPLLRRGQVLRLQLGEVQGQLGKPEQGSVGQRLADLRPALGHDLRRRFEAVQPEREAHGEGSVGVGLESHATVPLGRRAKRTQARQDTLEARREGARYTAELEKAMWGAVRAGSVGGMGFGWLFFVSRAGPPPCGQESRR